MKKKPFLKLIIIFIIIIIGTLGSLIPLYKHLNFGLDLKGGVHVMLQGIPDKGKSITSADMDKVKTVIEKRVNGLGISEPIIQVSGNDRLSVDIAGVKNPEAAVDTLGKTAYLTFYSDDNFKTPFLTGADLTKAKTEKNNQTGKYVVSLTFSDAGKKIFADETARIAALPASSDKKYITIKLDDKEISHASVDKAIPGGNAIIEGNYKTFADASKLAVQLDAGALPVKVNIVEKSTIEASLGKDALLQSFWAIIIGLAALSLLLICWYRLPGLITVISLMLFGTMLLWAIVFFGAVLTLPGIAGAILTIAIAADANIIIISRLKDELHLGKSLKASFDYGFKKAFITILDTNITSIFTALILMFFASGSIRGFAVILLIGLVINLFTSLVVTRYMMNLSINSRQLSKPTFYARLKKVDKEVEADENN